MLQKLQSAQQIDSIIPGAEPRQSYVGLIYAPTHLLTKGQIVNLGNTVPFIV